MKDGIINLLKPAGMTSHDGVQFLRRLTGIKRIGHTGTLDPMAVGVLPLCIGSATRIIEYLDLDDKQYRCEMQLGLVTDTQDVWGAVLSDCRQNSPSWTEADIVAAFAPIRGVIAQVPPQYSAVRVNGRRLYDYARNGEVVEVKSRLIEIKALHIIRLDLSVGLITFDVTCSKGTYIRTICHDVGEALGCGAVMSNLIRTDSGRFSLSDTVTMEALAEGGWESHLLSVDYPLVHFGRAVLRRGRGKWFSNGGHLQMSDLQMIEEPNLPVLNVPGGIKEEYQRAYRIYLDESEWPTGHQGFLGIAFYDTAAKTFIPDKIFFTATVQAGV